TDVSSWARLRSVLGLSASEGFFADGVILVEGDEDEAIIAAFAESRGVSLDAQGICLVSSGGKTKLPSLLAMYARLGITVFTIFDGDGQLSEDEQAKTELNKALLKMVGAAPLPRPATTIGKCYAVWDTTFVNVVKDAFGEQHWNGAFAKARDEYSISADHAKKKYAVIWRTVAFLLADKRPCEPAERLWDAIMQCFDIRSVSGGGCL
ncbi:MAG: ATP-dependent endonuclease, partial [Kiritimatiellae bacterium]|nr:ATP-dependent endonuclease [Kiritimatiellia bacterium]